MDASRQREWSWIALLVLAVFIAYRPALRGEFIWDDDQHVTKPALRSVEGLARIWTQPGAVSQYYPLVHSAFWVEHKLWGDTPFGYHLVNILLHALATVLLFRILRRLEIPGALLGAALFALHPIQVESVAWVSELKNTMSGVFYLGAILGYLRHDQTRQPGLYLAAFVLFILGLLSKTVIATLPAALLVVFWWKRGKLTWRDDVLPLLPFFAAGIISGLLTAWAEKQFIGAQGPGYQLTLLERCLIAGRAFWFYLGKLVWPARLIFIYPRWHISQLVWWQYLFPLAGALLICALWRLRRRWRGPLAALLYFAGTLFPALGFFNIFPFQFSFVADHFQYLACIGPLVLAAAMLQRFKLTASVLPLVLASLTWRHCTIYADEETIWRATLVHNPDCSLAHVNLGALLAERSQTEDAVVHYRRALEINPGDAAAYYNWANLLAAQGQLQQAMSFYEFALKFDPTLAAAHYNWGNLLASAGRLGEALAHYQATVQLQPDSAYAYFKIGYLLAARGQTDGAIAAYQVALRLRPDIVITHFNLANELAARGSIADAVAHYQTALLLKPDYAEAHFNLSAALAGQGRTLDALAHAERANQLTGTTNALMLTGLANLYAANGRQADALAAGERALSLAFAASNAPLAEAIRADLVRYRGTSIP